MISKIEIEITKVDMQTRKIKGIASYKEWRDDASIADKPCFEKSFFVGVERSQTCERAFLGDTLPCLDKELDERLKVALDSYYQAIFAGPEEKIHLWRVS